MAAPIKIADLLAKAKGAVERVRSAIPSTKARKADRDAEGSPFADLPVATEAFAHKTKGSTAGSASRPSTAELRSSLSELLRKPLVLAILASILVLGLAMAATAIAVSLPPRPGSASSAAVTREGAELLRRWLLPPGDPLELTMPMEREGSEPSMGEASRNFVHALAGQDISPLSAEVDSAIDPWLMEAP